MRVLIIGGTGLISTAITRFLTERGDDVTLYNRGIRPLQIPYRPKRIVGDRTDYAAFESQMAEAGHFDCIIDMVCFLPEDAPAPKLVHIPSELLYLVAPKQATWCLESFRFNNIFDNAAARADLGFRYTIRWVEGVRRVVAWLDEHGKIENSDDYPFYDRIITAWQELGEDMKRGLADLDL